MRRFYYLCGMAFLCTLFLATSCEKKEKEEEKTQLGGAFLTRSNCLYEYGAPHCIVELTPEEYEDFFGDQSGDSQSADAELRTSVTVVEPVIEPAPSVIDYNFDLSTGTGTISCYYYLSCDPDSIYSTVTVKGNEIIINNIEKLKENAGDCTCKYQIVSSIWGAEAKKYTITVMVNGDMPTKYELDLSKSTEGTLTHENF